MLGPLLIIICAILWATDAIFRLPLVSSFDAAAIVLYEHAICVALALPWFVSRRRELRALSPRGWIAIAFIGIVGSALGTYFFTASYKYLNPSITILLQKLQPVVAVLGARALLGETPKPSFYFWALVALGAGVVLSLPELSNWSEVVSGFPSLRNSSDRRLLGIVFALAAGGAWGLCTVFGKWVTAKVSFPVTAFLRFAFGLLGMVLLISLRLWNAEISFHLNSSQLLSILYMGLIPGTLAMYLYYAGLHRTKASAATFSEMVFPVAAILINWKVLGQALLPIQGVAMVILLIAVFSINKGLR